MQKNVHHYLLKVEYQNGMILHINTLALNVSWALMFFDANDPEVIRCSVELIKKNYCPVAESFGALCIDNLTHEEILSMARR